MRHRNFFFWIAISVLFIVMIVANIMIGAVEIEPMDVFRAMIGAEGVSQTTHFIIVESRSAAAVTAAMSGAAIATSGLLLQFLFRNALAGPSVLGISSGAGVGVAVATLSIGSGMTLISGIAWAHLATVVAASIGAIASTLLIMAVSARLNSDVMVLVVGMMIGQIAAALVALMSVMATADGLRGFVMWGMGSFGGVGWAEMLWLVVPTVVAICGAIVIGKDMNTAMLGENYASNLGINMRRLRHIVLLLASLLVAVPTAFCGPIALLGLAVPHIARLSLRTDDFRVLLPASIMVGAVVALICNVASSALLSGGQTIPINVLTPVICSPVIIYIILKQ